MSADYDRLFGPPEGEVPDDATARIDYDASPPPMSPMSAMPVSPPQLNGHSPAAGPSPLKPNGQAAPPMPIGGPQYLPPAPPEPPLAPPPPRPQPVDHHARHAHRRRRSHTNNGNGSWKAAPGPTEPLLPRADPSGLARAPTRHRADSRPDHKRARRAEPPAAQSDSASANGERRALRAPLDTGGGSAVSTPAAKIVSRRGWRRWVHTFTRINVGLSRDEKYELDLRTRIHRNPHGSYQIGVLGLKGGAGKTALTVVLGSVLAEVRGDRVLVIDADPGCGNLAERVGRQTDATIADLLAHNAVSHYNDIHTHTSANAVNLEVLAAEDYGAARRALSEQDWLYAVDAASRYYNLVLADCGSDFFDPATRGVLSTVSGVVIVASASVDGAEQASVAIDWLSHNGYQGLLTHACVVINHVVPGEPNVAVRDLVRRFEQQVQPGRVVVLPWDKHIAAGTDIQLGVLGRTYRRRILELAAALSDDFDKAVPR